MSSASKMKTDFILAFATLVGEYGDMFFTSGSIDDDYAHITSTIDRQGFWSGVSYRYYFDKNYKLLRTEERIFGN